MLQSVFSDLDEHHCALKVSVDFLAVLKRGELWTSFYLFEPFVHRSIFTEVLMVWNCFQDKTAQRKHVGYFS